MSTSRKATQASAAGSELERLRHRYDQLLNGNLAGVFRTTLAGRFVECNDAMAHALGYAGKEELMALPAGALYFEQADRDVYLAELQRTDRLVNYEIKLRRKDGSPMHALENVYLDRSGEEPTVLGMLMDITAQKQAESEQRALSASLRELLERLRDGVLVVVDGRVAYANSAARSMTERDPQGEQLTALFHTSDQELVGAMLEQASTRGQAECLARMGAMELLLFAGATVHEGRPAVQVALQDNAARERILRDRVQLRIAEEVNQVLREQIEEHRRTQEELRQSRRFARSLINSSLDMIMAADEQGRITEYNPAASMRFGYEPEEAVGLDTRLLYADPDEYARVQSELERHGVYAGEVRNKDKFGNIFTSFLSASKLHDEEGRVIGAMGVSRDITRMKQDQEALRASEERYRDLFENATDLIQSVRPDGRLEYVNEAWRRTLGYSDAEVARLSIWDLVHPDHAATCKRFFERILLGDAPGEIRTVFVAKDGRPVTVEGSTSLRMENGRPVATRSIFRDITSALSASKRLQEHEAKWKALFESSEHMFWTVDAGIRLTSFNRGYAAMIQRLYGVVPELNLDPGRPRKKFASDDYHAFWEEKYRIALDGSPVRFETDRTDAQGARVCNEVFLSPVFGPDGQVREVFGIGHEITEQKLAEETVREQGARLKAIFESSANMMIWTLDRALRITSYNPHFQRAIEQTHGIRFGVGDPFAERMAGRVAPQHVKPLQQRYANALRGKPQQFEVELIDLHGEPAWVENFLNPIVVDGEVTEISCLAYGITDRKEAQRALEQSLAEKEVLLREVHHRVKNNLQVISSITKLQERREGLDAAVREMLHHSRDRIRSMALIHERLYQNKQFSGINLAEYIDGLARELMLSYSTSGRVGLELDLEDAHLGIDQAMPCGLLLNELISNALKHAYPEGAAGTVRVRLRCQGDTVRIEVSDDGPGLPAGFDDERDGGLGMELIATLTGQLDGRMARESRNGLAYLLTFERDNRKPHGADERLGR